MKVRVTLSESQTSVKVQTFDDLARLDPGLQQLEADVRRVKAGPRFCANAVWYGYGDYASGFKARLCRLVGWEARTPALQTSTAYDVAYEHLYELLPNCRATCACWRIMGALIG